jgi:hypothetical protein
MRQNDPGAHFAYGKRRYQLSLRGRGDPVLGAACVLGPEGIP